jgi:hypothetical protein
VLEAEPADAATLIIRPHRHVRQIDRPLAVGEIRFIDGPRLFRREAKRCDDGRAPSRDPYLRVAEIGDDAAF